jgi:hypothetical protein
MLIRQRCVHVKSLPTLDFSREAKWKNYKEKKQREKLVFFLCRKADKQFYFFLNQ